MEHNHSVWEGIFEEVSVQYSSCKMAFGDWTKKMPWLHQLSEKNKNKNTGSAINITEEARILYNWIHTLAHILHFAQEMDVVLGKNHNQSE